MDGNFSAVHQRRQHAAPDIPLTSGNLFMVNETAYNCHIQTAVELKEACLANLKQLQLTIQPLSRPLAMNTMLFLTSSSSTKDKISLESVPQLVLGMVHLHLVRWLIFNAAKGDWQTTYV